MTGYEFNWRTRVIEEIWKEIANTEGAFEVSNHGRVRNNDYVSLKGLKMKAKIKKLSVSIGYLRVRIAVGGLDKLCRVHRLVAAAFIPNSNPRENKYVLHGDDNPTNNHFENLRWGSQQHNMDDKVERGRCPDRRGEKAGNSKLTEKDVIQINEMLASGEYLQREIASKFGVAQATIYSIKRGKTWTHIKG